MSVIDLKTIYETDEFEWLQLTIQLLKTRQLDEQVTLRQQFIARIVNILSEKCFKG